MALPLPKVVADVGPGGQLVTSMGGINALSQDMLENRIKGSQAQYAPWTNYADAASKIAYSNMLPYQIQATVMSNPYLWMALKDKPQALNALMQNMAQSIPNPDQMRTGANMPPTPGTFQRSDGLLSMLINSLMGGKSSEQQSQPGNPMGDMPGAGMPGAPNPLAMGGVQQPSAQSNPLAPPASSPATGNALVPGAQGGVQGIIGKQTAPFMQSPFDQGKTVATDEGIISVPTGQMTEQAQQAIQGIKNLKPILTDISKGAEKWLAPGAKGKVGLGQVMNGLQQTFGTLGGVPKSVMDYFGVTSKDVSEYADWQAQQQKAVETIMKARQWPQDQVALQKISKIIEPIPGEGKEYGDRVARELNQLEGELLPSYKEALSGGYELNKPQVDQDKSPVQKPQTTKEAIKQTGENFKNQMIKMQGVDPKDGKVKTWNVPQGKAQAFLDAGFKRIG